jgi:hypothetical protein
MRAQAKAMQRIIDGANPHCDIHSMSDVKVYPEPRTLGGLPSSYSSKIGHIHQRYPSCPDHCCTHRLFSSNTMQSFAMLR